MSSFLSSVLHLAAAGVQTLAAVLTTFEGRLQEPRIGFIPSVIHGSDSEPSNVGAMSPNMHVSAENIDKKICNLKKKMKYLILFELRLLGLGLSLRKGKSLQC